MNTAAGAELHTAALMLRDDSGGGSKGCGDDGDRHSDGDGDGGDVGDGREGGRGDGDAHCGDE